jgi:LuxR family quorum sensing-dependent transcriptional regulator
MIAIRNQRGAMTRGERDPRLDVFAFIDELAGLSQVDDVLDAMAARLARVGFESVILAELPQGRQRIEDVVLGNRWPEQWFELYTRNEFIRHDPLIPPIKRRTMPFEWDQSFYRGPDRRAVEVLERAADFGLKHGYMVPIHGAGRSLGLVSMSGNEPNLAAQVKPALHLMALYAFEQLRRLVGPIEFEKQPLTDREREVLALVAQGKPAWQIGELLNIAKRTVDDHAQTAFFKLGAVNRTHAVAIAMRDGLIQV